MVDKAELIKEVREYALANYTKDGWDFLVECWDYNEIAEQIGNATTVKGAIANCRQITRMLAEQRSEVQATEW